MLKQSQCDCNGEAKRLWSLTVQSPVEDAGADGHTDYTLDANWTTQGTIRASFTSRSGREFVQANQVQADQSHTLECVSTNFSRSIQTTWRLVLGTRKFEILEVYDVDEMRQTVRIGVKEQK